MLGVGRVHPDAAHVDAPSDTREIPSPDAIPDSSESDAIDSAPKPECEVYGAPGACITVEACAALGDHTSYSGHCPGPDDVQCCIVTPNVADNPPVPSGYTLMAQSDVTPDMTTWAVEILDDPVTYPMYSTTTKTFGTLDVLARVEWHPPDFLNSAVHRGVTLYQPI